MKTLTNLKSVSRLDAKVLFNSIFLIALLIGISAFDCSAQSLAMKKQQKEIDATIDDYKKEIVEKCGEFEFGMSVDYNSFETITDKMGLIPTQGFKQVSNALRAICTNPNDSSQQDADASAAVKAKIKSVVITHIADPKKKTLELKDGVLTIKNSFGTPSGVLDYVKIKELLFKLL